MEPAGTAQRHYSNIIITVHACSTNPFYKCEVHAGIQGVSEQSELTPCMVYESNNTLWAMYCNT